LSKKEPKHLGLTIFSRDFVVSVSRHVHRDLL